MYLNFVDIGGMVSHTTAVARSFAAAIRHQPGTSLLFFFDPHTAGPVYRAVTATALKLVHRERDSVHKV